MNFIRRMIGLKSPIRGFRFIKLGYSLSFVIYQTDAGQQQGFPKSSSHSHLENDTIPGLSLEIYWPLLDNWVCNKCQYNVRSSS